MTFSLELWVEGSSDWLGLPNIVRRTLRDLSGLSEQAFDRLVPPDRVSFKVLGTKLKGTQAYPGFNGEYSSHARKILAAFDKVPDGDVLVVAVWDRDGRKDRLDDRNAVNEHLLRHAKFGKATAVCVEALEAWFLADAQSYKTVFGRGPSAGLPGDPEAAADPKDLLKNLDIEDGHTAIDRLDKLADAMDLKVLLRQCRVGYGSFVDDSRSLVVPKLSGK
jgi:hypothetical protein